MQGESKRLNKSLFSLKKTILIVDDEEINREILSMMLDNGCDVIQGYYFSKTLPQKDFEELIKKDLEKK